jgi:ribosomal protein L15
VQAALACTTAQVALIDVIPRGSSVLITGAARQVLAGQKVSVKLLGTGKVVASATVQADGSFSATAPLPAVKIRNTNKARYEASVGSDHSQALKLERRMYMTSAVLSGPHVLLSGYVTGSFKKGSTVEILLRVTCSKEEVIAKVKLTGSGKFTATVPAASATASEIAVYRAHTTVLNGTHPATTYTLPTPASS